MANEEIFQRQTSSITTSTVPHECLTSRNNEWMQVQTTIQCAILDKDIGDLTDVLQIVRNISKSQLGTFIFDYYEKQILKTAMRILRKNMEDKTGADLLQSLEAIWTKFYSDSLNKVNLILYQISTPSSTSIQMITLQEFKYRIVLKTNIKEALEQNRSSISPSIRQMMIILHLSKQNSIPSKKDLYFESLVALVADPFIGHGGVYKNGKCLNMLHYDEVF